jgi:hypothetical protein
LKPRQFDVVAVPERRERERREREEREERREREREREREKSQNKLLHLVSKERGRRV